MILAYYLVITGWVLAYFLAFAAGAPVAFAEFTGSYSPLLFFLLAGGLCFLVVQSGVCSGLERLCHVQGVRERDPAAPTGQDDGALTGQPATVYVPALNDIFKTAPLSPAELGQAVLIAGS
jgi:hypothetical protein